MNHASAVEPSPALPQGGRRPLGLVVVACSLVLLVAACGDSDRTGAGGDGATGNGDGVIEATEGFVPVVDGEEKLGCGAFGFRPGDKEFRDAFNEELNNLQQEGGIFPLVEEFGFTRADVNAAKDVTVSDLAPNAIEGEGGGGLLEELRDAGRIIIGFANERPYGFEGPDGEPDGGAPAVARAVLEELGITEVDGVVVEFGALINGLNADQFDMIAAGMFINDERAQQILFSDPDYCASTALAVEAGNPLGLSDFASIVKTGEATLGVLSGAVEEGYATGVGIPDERIQRFDNTANLFDALVAGRVDAVALTSITVGEQVELINEQS